MSARAIILAAGFGTRLGAIGENCPKALLPVGGRRTLDPLMDDLANSTRVSEIVLVTNSRFAGLFREWLESRKLAKPWVLLDDGVTEPTSRLGAVGDLEFALSRVGRDPALVLGADNLYTFDVTGLIGEMERHGHSAVCVLREIGNLARQMKSCVILNGGSVIARMVEKPEEPISDLTVPPLYAYDTTALELVPEYLASGRDPDTPGHLCSWLCEVVPVAAWFAEGQRLDVGTPASLRRAQRQVSMGAFRRL